MGFPSPWCRRRIVSNLSEDMPGFDIEIFGSTFDLSTLYAVEILVENSCLKQAQNQVHN